MTDWFDLFWSRIDLNAVDLCHIRRIDRINLLWQLKRIFERV